MKTKAQRPSPSQSAAETDPGTIMKGNDRAQWIVKETSRGIRRWVRIPNEKGKIYLTQFNGGHPYKVVIGKNGIFIFAKDHSVVEDVFIDKVIHLKKHLKVFVGDYKGKFYKTSASDKGNTLLISLGKNKYLFVGDTVFSFTAPDPIRAYQSPIDNSNVPYPWVIGTENIYLLNEKIFIPHEMRNTKFCPYTQYYSKMSRTEQKTLERQCKIRGLKIIHSSRK